MFLVAIMPGKMPILLFILKTVQVKCNFAAGEVTYITKLIITYITKLIIRRRKQSAFGVNSKALLSK